MMQLIAADSYGHFVREITEMHRLRYRVFKERFDWDVQFSGDMEIDEFDALQAAYLIQPARDNRVARLRTSAPFDRSHHAARYFSRAIGRSTSPH